MWAIDQTYKVKNALPSWIIPLLIIGGGGGLYAWESRLKELAMVGLVLAVFAVIAWLAHEFETTHKQFALGLELNSGRRTSFISTDEEFIVKAADSLLIAMTRGLNSEEKLVMNFDNKTVYVEKATNSNIIGGNVSDSLVNSV